MATTPDFVEYVQEQSGLGNALSYRKMFGEYALYLDGKVVALACDNSLYVRLTEAVKHLEESLPSAPPYPGAKPYLVLDEILDDTEILRKVLLDSAAVLPVPKVKVKKQSNRKKGM